MTSRKLRSLLRVAHHEAGHAVAHWRSCIRFRYVTIKPDAGSLGHVKILKYPAWFTNDESTSDSRRLEYARRQLVINFAGQIAEARFFGKRPRYGMDSDNISALEIAQYVLPRGSQKTVEAYLRYCFSASEDLLWFHWREVERLANALVERQTIPFKDAMEIMTPGYLALRDSLQPKKSRKRNWISDAKEITTE